MKKWLHGIDVTRFLNSRYWLLVNAAMVVILIVAYAPADVVVCWPSGVFCLDTPDRWMGGGSLSRWVACGGVAVIAAALYLINATYNIIHSMTLIYATLFVTAVASMPATTADGVNGSIVLAAAVFMSLLPLFSTYQSPRSTRSVFLVFAVATTVTALCCPFVACVVLLAVMLVAVAQMRIFGLRTLLAALIGIATPLWILWGFGVVDHIEIVAPSTFTLDSRPEWLEAKYCMGMALTVLLWLVLSAVNLVRIYNYNARLRAYNGVLTLLGIGVLTLIVIDFANTPLYMPLLAGCMGVQVGHSFTINHGSRSWTGILAVSVPYWLAIVWCFV